MRHIPALLAVLVLAMLPTFATQETRVYDFHYGLSVADDTSGPRVDWVRKAVLITTKAEAPSNLFGVLGRDDARAHALAAARVKYLDYLNEMRLTTYASVHEASASGYLPAPKLSLFGKVIHPVLEIWDPTERTLTLVTAMPLNGQNSPYALAASMLQVEQEAFANQNPIQWYPKPAPVQPAVGKTPPPGAPDKAKVPQQYTGIILDCTKIHYAPVLLPKLISEDGTVLWGLLGIKPADVATQGMIEYTTSMKAAMLSGRAGAHPWIIRPLATRGPSHGDIVLSNEAAQQLEDVLFNPTSLPDFQLKAKTAAPILGVTYTAPDLTNKLSVIAIID